jgi:hypothetical protein
MCGWRPHGQTETSLVAAQREFDLCGAIRAAGPSGERDLALLARLSARVRGGMPSPGRLDQLAAAIDAAEPPPPRTSAGIDFALTRLVAGLTEAIAFIEIGPDAVAVQTLVAGALGVPAQPVGDSLRWPDFLPLLPGDDYLRRLRMAGGARLGEGIPAALGALVGEAINPALAKLLATAAGVTGSRAEPGATGGNSLPPQGARRLDVVIIRRTYRWPVLDAAVAHARLLLRPVAEIVAGLAEGDVESLIYGLSARAPLRYGYNLVVAAVSQPGRAVRVREEPVFSAGAAVRPGASTTVTVRVGTVPGACADRVALPVVARRTEAVDFREPGAVDDKRPLVHLAELAGASGPTDVGITLVRPGLLSFQGASDWSLAGGTSPDWPALLARVPSSLPPAASLTGRGLDLVLVIELGGEEQVVADRVLLAREIIGVFRSAPPDVRIAVLGHRDHFGRHRVDAIPVAELEDQALVIGCKLTTAVHAASMFSRAHPWDHTVTAPRWNNVPIGDNTAAPVEDVLQMIAGRKWNWRPDARHVLLIVGARPPHPPRVGPDGAEVLPCPRHWSWQDAYARLVDRQSLECHAVLDRPITRGYAADIWGLLAPRRVYSRQSVTAAELVRTIGLLPATAALVELPLAVLAGPVTLPQPRVP